MTTWTGAPPEHCDFCRNPIRFAFIDGRTIHGPWANMCPSCYRKHGVGIGTGQGQEYRLSSIDGRYHKVPGKKQTVEQARKNWLYLNR